PLTLEGFAILHQMFRVRRTEWRATQDSARQEIVDEAVQVLDRMTAREDGETALFAGLGHKSDVLAVHFRRTFDELSQAQLEIAGLVLSDYLEPVSSYVSMIEIGVYEASVELYTRLTGQMVKPHSAQWQNAVEAELNDLRLKMAPRLFPRIPERRYLCFYPMDKKREGTDNWYMLPIDKRRRLMQEHGMVGRRFAGKVTQVISGSVGFDDWEWGVDLFADDPLVFKKLVYEMRFDEASAAYAKFGPFYIGIRITPSELGHILIA